MADLILRALHANGIKMRGPRERPARLRLPDLPNAARKKISGELNRH
jgi:hypothetical protein